MPGLPPAEGTIEAHNKRFDGTRNVFQLDGPDRLKLQVEFLNVVADDG
jgi:hypothetical protein